MPLKMELLAVKVADDEHRRFRNLHAAVKARRPAERVTFRGVAVAAIAALEREVLRQAQEEKGRQAA